MYWCTSVRAQVHSVMLVRLTERAAVCPHLHYRCHVNIWWGLNLVFRGYWTVMDLVLHSELYTHHELLAANEKSLHVNTYISKICGFMSCYEYLNRIHAPVTFRATPSPFNSDLITMLS